MSGKLTAKQQRFIQEYLIDLNATQAAIRAGYSEKTATEIGYENLRKPHVAAAVVVGAKKAGERAQVDTDYVLRGLVKEAELTGEGSSQAGRTAALSWIGKHLLMFAERRIIEPSDVLADVLEAIGSRPRPVLPQDMRANGHANGDSR